MCIISTSVTATIAAVLTAVTSAATAATTTAVGLAQVQNQKKITQLQIEQTKKEAKNAEMQAAYERQEGIENARKQKINAILNMENEKAKIAGNNISISSDTVLNLENDAKINSELDALTTQRQAEQKAQNYMNKKSNLYRNAALISFNNKINNSNVYAQLGNSMLNFTASSINK